VWWKDRVLVRMVEVKILRSLKVQCLKILEQRIVESVSYGVGSKDLPPGVDLGLFIGRMGVQLTFQSSNYLHSRKCAS
jgi:hypothetical protein